MIAPWPAVVAARVAQARTTAGLSKAAFAAALGMRRQTYQLYEAAARPFSLALLERVSAVTSRPLVWLLGLDAELDSDEALLLEAFRSLGDPALRALALQSVQLQRDYAFLRRDSPSGPCP